MRAPARALVIASLIVHVLLRLPAPSRKPPANPVGMLLLSSILVLPMTALWLHRAGAAIGAALADRRRTALDVTG